jgi:putative flippase GtrA
MAQLVNTLQNSDTLRSAARFMLVGALGTFVDVALFTVLHVLLGAPPLAANTLSYSAGIVNNYFFHRTWTFALRPQKAAGRQFTQFAGVSLSALVANNLIVLLLAPALGALFAEPALGAIFAKICATGVGMGWNFLANHLWTFQAESTQVG